MSMLGVSRSVLLNSLTFILGFSIVFILLGAVATGLGQLTRDFYPILTRVAGAIIIVFGLHLTGIWKIKALYADKRLHDVKGSSSPWGTFAVGFAFAFGWTPCIGPVLGAILTLSATQGAGGTELLAIYAAGLGLPFLLVALFTRELAARMRVLRRVGWILQILAGLVLVAMGIAMMTGQLSTFAFWLLETFPALGRIG